jgi:hypothetical protein
MLLARHVDEIDDDDTAEIAQAKLMSDGHRRLEIGAVTGVFLIAVADVGAGIHIDRGHGLGLVDHDVTTGLQRHLALQCARHLFLDAMQCKQRPGLVIQHEAGPGLGHEGIGEGAHALEFGGRIDQHARHSRAKFIAQHAHRQRQFCVQQPAAAIAVRALADVLPQPREVEHIGRQRLRGDAFGRGAHDVAATAHAVGGGQVAHRAAQPLALDFIDNARRNADAGRKRRIHHEA